MLLLPLWYLAYRPLAKSEGLMFVIAAVSIVGQNYAVLKRGGFAFAQQDFLLMPWYEPLMWGYYYLFLRRLIGEPGRGVSLGLKAVLGLTVTGLCFSLFSQDKTALLLATSGSTALLLVFFHRRYDLCYATAALALGFVVELFGVWTGLWDYPDPDVLGIPFWFATMWISVGLLGRRFLIPLSEWLAERFPGKDSA